MTYNNIPNPGIFQPLASFLTIKECTQLAGVNHEMATHIRTVFYEAVSTNESHAIEGFDAVPPSQREECGGNCNATAIAAGVLVGKLENPDPLNEMSPKMLMHNALPSSLEKMQDKVQLEKRLEEEIGKKHPDHDLVRFLLSHLTEEKRGDFLRKSPNAAISKLVLDSGSITMEDRGIATYRAAAENDPDRVRLLLQKGTISRSHRMIAIDNAKPHNNDELMRALGLTRKKVQKNGPPPFPGNDDRCVLM